MGVGPPDGWLPVDVSGPVSQVEDEEEDRKYDARYLVHFADSVVGLLDTIADVLAVHPGQPHRLGRGQSRGLGLDWDRGGAGSALSDGGQSRFFSHAHRVSGAYDVKRVVGLFGE